MLGGKGGPREGWGGQLVLEVRVKLLSQWELQGKEEPWERLEEERRRSGRLRT